GELLAELGRLGDHAGVGFRQGGGDDLDGLLPHLAGDRGYALIEERRRVRALGALLRTLRDRPPESGREAGQRARVARRPGRAHTHEERVAVAVVADLL